MHPIIWHFKNITIETLWLLIAAGIIVGGFTIIKLSIKNGSKILFISENAWKLFIVGLLGGRLVGVLLNLPIYIKTSLNGNPLSIFRFFDGTFNLWGALIITLFYFYRLCKKHEQDFFKWLDVLVPSYLITVTAGHLGAFFAGINYGRETSLPWGVKFESFSVKYTVPIHPTQIYAFIYTSIITWFLIHLHYKKYSEEPPKTGYIGVLGILLYNGLTFLQEFLRGDDVLMLFGIRTTQIFALIVTIAVGTFFFFRYNRSRKSKTNK